MLRDQRVKAVLVAAGASHRGRVRRVNEDSYLFRIDEAEEAGDFVVCDGMGGAAGGEIASRIAAETMLASVSNTPLTVAQMQKAVDAANEGVHSQAENDLALAGMGTTLVMLAVRGTQAWVANVGDSRCYRLRAGKLERLTQDHSLVDEQVRMGRLTPEQAAVSPFRNVITRAVGTGDHVTADIQEIALSAGDFYLLASDGLTRELDDDRIAQIISTGDPPEQIVEGLIQAANQAGGHDNITCLVVHLA